jgi:hypothetical protein
MVPDERPPFDPLLMGDRGAWAMTLSFEKLCERLATFAGVVGRLRVLLVALAFVCLDCGSHAAMRSAPNFSGKELKNRKVLVLPIAVTDDYGDERTGIILDRGTREEATRMACASASDRQRDLTLTCFDSPAVSSAAPVSDAVQAQFTRDRAVPKDQWLALAQQTGNDFAVLFRPEAVTSSRHQQDNTIVHATAGAAMVMAGLLGGLLIEAAAASPKVVRTRGYTLSAVLVDLRAGTEVRAAVRSGEGTADDQTEIPVSSVLDGIMKALLADLLDH